MKRIATYFLIVLYFIISVGVSLNIHFCKGKVKSVSFVQYGKDYSCCGKKKMKKGCCKNVSFSVKKQSKDKAPQFCKAVIEKEVSLYVKPVIDYWLQLKKEDCNRIEQTHSPPLGNSYPDLYIKHCVFRI